ncbi:MAG: hypothetical protein IKJ13_04545 [Clostridia bacterium]|nr:hypothetical protein [Clostridia bacterium]
MKTTKITKALVLALSLVLLVGSAIGISVAAEEATATDSTAKISAQSIVHDDKIQIAFAIDATEDEVKAGVAYIEYYFDGDSANTKKAALYTAAAYQGKAILVTEGLAAQDLTSVVTATSYLNGAAVDTKTYSVVQFLLTKLYKDGFATLSTNSTSVEKELVNKRYANLYNSLIDYAAKAQDVFDHGETSIKNYFTVQISDGRENPFTLHTESFKLTLPTTISISNATFKDKWYVTEVGSKTYTEYAAGEEVTISTHTVITPVVEANYGTGKYFNDTTVAGQRLNFSKDTDYTDYFFTNNDKKDGATYETPASASITKIDTDNDGVADNAILSEVADNWNGFVVESKDSNKYVAGKYVFEADFSFSTPKIYNDDGTGSIFISFMPNVLDENMKNIASGSVTAYKNTANTFAYASGYLTVTGTKAAPGNEYTLFDRNTPLQVGVVYNIRFEYDVTTKLITSYLNGVKTGTYQANASGSNRIVTDDSEFFGIGLYHRVGGMNLTFDNIFIGVVDGVVAE